MKYVAADDGEIISSFEITDAKYKLPAKVNIDGDFSDWDNVPSYYDPLDDVHDTDTEGRDGEPTYREHPDVDLLEYKVTHDNENLYFYMRAAGEIGETQVENQQLNLRAGRYYVIVTIDVDDNDETGYWLDDGGYYPTTNGYDMNAEIEFYNGEFNTGHYINHGAVDNASLLQAFKDQTNGEYIPGSDGPYSPGFINILPGTYDYYTQWVYDDNGTDTEYDDQITFVLDRGPIVLGIVTGARSEDLHEIEMVAPLKGFLKDANGNPIIDFGSIIDISFSLEASGELAPGQDWGSDTGSPINGYVITEEPQLESTFGFGDTPVVQEDSGFHSFENFMTFSGGGNREFVISNNNEMIFTDQPTIDFETGELTFSTAPDKSGVAVVSVTEYLDGEEVETRKFAIYIQPTNDAPIANDDFYNVFSNTFDNPFTPLDNDSIGPDVFESLSIVSVQHHTDQGGTVELVNGQVLYTPKPTFSGTDSFEYTMTDGSGLEASATIYVTVVAAGAPNIVIDGDMSDWDNPAIAQYFDPEDDQHDTDTSGRNGTPVYVDHPNADLLEYRVTNDEENLYFYFRSRGQIGATSNSIDGPRAGRYYVIVTIDVDQDDNTGYWLDDGGYYPTTNGYDMNAEIEYYDGTFNTGHYLNHGAQTSAELTQAFLDQTRGAYTPGFDGPYQPGFVNILPGTYQYYTQWVYQENNPAIESDDQITLVVDRGPVVLGIIQAAISADGHSLEMIAPMKGFLKDQNGDPIIKVGSILDLSFSLEASGELSNEVTPSNPNGTWASDTADPLNGYVVQGAAASNFPSSRISTPAVPGLFPSQLTGPSQMAKWSWTVRKPGTPPELTSPMWATIFQTTSSSARNSVSHLKQARLQTALSSSITSLLRSTSSQEPGLVRTNWSSASMKTTSSKSLMKKQRSSTRIPITNWICRLKDRWLLCHLMV
ncbi:MAG: Ig-like domain-containing protein [Planctomycetaceae bacterium]